ncbi:MAG: serine hydrolase [Pseudomonadota bacterium]|nr:serine hydrolase [Pseudomonadota bacterium]
MNTHQDFMDASLPGNAFFHPTRREFLAALASCSAGLLLGTPSFLEAAANRASLQGQVVDLVKRMRSQRLILPDEKTSWSVYDFTTRKKLVAINEDIPRQAASMIKPFVAQAYFYKVEDSGGKLRYTSDARYTMERMIRRSSNTATNRIMSIVSRHENNRGARDVERVLKDNAPGIFRQTRIVETIPANGRTYRNLASAHDYSRFLFALWNNRLPYAAELRKLMALSNRDRISDGVRSMPSNVKVYDKTGSTARLCGDMGIIEVPGRRGKSYPYTFIGIIERPSRARNYGSWITRRSNAIRAVSNLVYLDMKKRHRLA